MKRVIALFMSVVMVLSLAACGSAEGGRESRGSRDSREENISDKEIEALRANEGPMLEITCTIQAPIPDDMDRDSTLVLGYNGMIMNPDEYGQNKGPVSDEDYMTIYEFCIDAVENDTYADYYEDVCDGQTYRFVFTDEDGDAHVIYDGYIYDNRELNFVHDLINNYYLQ